MRVKTFGSTSARSAAAWTTQSATGWRARFRIQTTSKAVHAAAPASTSSIGRMTRLRPPASGAPSATTACPLPLSTTKETPSDHLTRAFIGRLAIHPPRRRRPSARHRVPPRLLLSCQPPIARSAPFVPRRDMHLALCSAIWNAYACSRPRRLLLRHRERIPPFSSYGGILGAVLLGPRHFFPSPGIAPHHPC